MNAKAQLLGMSGHPLCQAHRPVGQNQSSARTWPPGAAYEHPVIRELSTTPGAGAVASAV